MKPKRTKYRYFYSQETNNLRSINANCLSDKSILIYDGYGRRYKPLQEGDSVFTGNELVS